MQAPDQRDSSARRSWDPPKVEAGPGVIGVLLDAADAATARERGVDHFAAYSLEILAHAGLPHVRLERASLGGTLPRIILLPYALRLEPREVEALEAHVSAGGAIVACGGVEGADDLFGLERHRRHLTSGSIAWPEGALGIPGGEMPAWNARVLKASADGTPLGELLDPDGQAVGAAAVRRKAGEGFTLCVGADIAGSVVRLQQGWPVVGDGEPAPDGSAPLDDRIDKCDDGSALAWRYREEVAGQLAFLTPFADRLRELLLAALLEAAEATGEPLALAWYWPGLADAVGHLSHDTDSNEGPDGWEFKRFLESIGVRGTWCVMYPGGYPRELYDALARDGHELALHFDALTTDYNGSPRCTWSEDDLRHQYAWLKEAAGLDGVRNQKNHVTRWEGWVEFYRWLERAGIPVDSTKGPSKVGNLGFNFGTSHPYRPIEDALHGHRLFDLLELPFLSMDMWQTEQRRPVRRALLDSARRHNGVAHFLFHPQRIWEDGMRESIEDIVRYGREAGLQWWTSRQILEWQLARRATRVQLHPGSSRLQLTAADAPDGLSAVISSPRRPDVSVAEEGEFLGHRVWRVPDVREAR